MCSIHEARIKRIQENPDAIDMCWEWEIASLKNQTFCTDPNHGPNMIQITDDLGFGLHFSKDLRKIEFTGKLCTCKSPILKLNEIITSIWYSLIFRFDDGSEVNVLCRGEAVSRRQSLIPVLKGSYYNLPSDLQLNQVMTAHMYLSFKLAQPGKPSSSSSSYESVDFIPRPKYFKNLTGTQSCLPQNNDDKKKDFLDFRELFEKQYFSDVTFHVEKKVLKVHKNILSMYSPVFLEQFTPKDDQKNSGECEIVELGESVKYDTMYRVFRYMYTGELQESINCQELKDVMLVAKKYGIRSLVDRCSQNFRDLLNVRDAFEILKISDLLEEENLKKFAIEFVAKNITKFDEQTISTLESGVLAKITMALANIRE